MAAQPSSADLSDIATLNAAAIDGVTVTGTPTSGQVPVASNGTTAAWGTPAGGSGTPIYPCNSASGSGTAYTCTTGSSVTLAVGMLFAWVPDTACSTALPTLAVDANTAHFLVANSTLIYPYCGTAGFGPMLLEYSVGQFTVVSALSTMPNPSTSTLGGVKSLAVVPHKWINTISTAGAPAATQPASTDLSDISTLNAAAVGGITVTGTPSLGNVLTATSATAADWEAPSGGGTVVEEIHLLVGCTIGAGTYLGPWVSDSGFTGLNASCNSNLWPLLQFSATSSADYIFATFTWPTGTISAVTFSMTAIMESSSGSATYVAGVDCWSSGGVFNTIPTVTNTASSGSITYSASNDVVFTTISAIPVNGCSAAGQLAIIKLYRSAGTNNTDMLGSSVVRITRTLP